jgi:hypothetical protein
VWSLLNDVHGSSPFQLSGARDSMLFIDIGRPTEDPFDKAPVAHYNTKPSHCRVSCLISATFAGISIANMHRACLLLTTLLFLTPQTAIAEVMDVKIGMPMQEVLTILGEPDRKAILSGKLLRDVPENSTEILPSKSRIVFIYKHNVQVWFRQGHVTGVTKDGVSIHQSK